MTLAQSVPLADLDPNLVTPGVIGFLAIALIAVATILLILDMTRRIRRTRYREEIRERLADEARAEGSPDVPGKENGPGDANRTAGS